MTHVCSLLASSLLFLKTGHSGRWDSWARAKLKLLSEQMSFPGPHPHLETVLPGSWFPFTWNNQSSAQGYCKCLDAKTHTLLNKLRHPSFRHASVCHDKLKQCGQRVKFIRPMTKSHQKDIRQREGCDSSRHLGKGKHSYSLIYS